MFVSKEVPFCNLDYSESRNMAWKELQYGANFPTYV